MSCSHFPVRRIAIRALLLLAFLLCACGHKEPAPPAHYAVIAFENLSGDSSLDWVARGAGEFLSRALPDTVSADAVARAGQSLGAHPENVPGISAARAAAIAAGANRIVTGYVERAPGGVRITATEENTVTHQTGRTLFAIASSPFEALKLLALEFSGHPRPAITNNPEALRLYSLALEAPVSDSPELLEKALALDPAFGRAWVALARARAAQGDRAAASAVIERARAQNIAPVDRAWLDFEDADLAGDRAAILTATRKLSDFNPGDADLARNLADAETVAGNFTEAAAVWKKLTVSSPGDANAWNQLGYALSWSGDYSGALAAIREYARLAPAEANPLDSEGDVHFWFGKYNESAVSYAAANAKTPGFLNGGELYKGAWAKFFAGDKAAADALFDQFRKSREKGNDPGIGILAGDWLYRTGRSTEAVTLLRDASRKETANTPPAVRNGIAVELTLWDLLAGDRASAVKDAATAGSSNLSSGVVMMRFAALPSAPASEWESRAAHDFTIPQLAALRSTALGYALILDGKKQAAIPYWEDVVKKASGRDFFTRGILARLKGQPVEHRSPPDPASLNEFVAIADKL